MKRDRQWRWQVVGAIGVTGLFAFGLALQSVPSKGPPTSEQPRPVTNTVRLVKAGPGIPMDGALPVFAPVTVDYRSDGPGASQGRGVVAGPASDLVSWEPSAGGSKANPGVHCVVDGDCYECNACVDYECIDFMCEQTIIAGQCVGDGNDREPCDEDGDCPSPDEGACDTSTAEGIDGCDDGEYCNGAERCVDGACVAGTPVDCGAHVCDEGQDACANPCANAGDCDDGRVCTDDACVDQVCVHTNACGPEADCLEPGICIPGRCCDANENCTRQTYAECLDDLGDWLAAGNSETDCDDVVSRCPTYGSGIFADANLTAVVGPISNLGCDNIVRFGDDYQASNHPEELFMILEALRWVGGVFPGVDARWVIELRTEDGTPIADVFYPSGANDSDGFGVRTVIFDPPITVPTKGIISFSVVGGFGSDGRVLVGTTDVVDVGGNEYDPDTMYVETSARVPQIRNYLGVCAGGDRDGLACDVANGNDDCTGGGTCNDIDDVMSFELVGPETTEPLGACCDSETGECSHQLPWKCTGVFQGVGTLCGICPDGLTQCVTDSDCDPPEPGSCDTTDHDECNYGACCEPDGGCRLVQDALLCDDPGTEIFLGFGTDCDPDCCVQPTTSYNGGDDCLLAESGMPVINVPPLGAPPVTATFTIDTSAATFYDSDLVCREGPNAGGTCTQDADCGGGQCVGGTNNGEPCEQDADCPDPLQGACEYHDCVEICGAPFLDKDGETRDRGWWVAFELDACAEVRIDFCCTDIEGGLVRPAWGTLYSECPCLGIVERTGVDDPIGIGRGTQGFARGAPFCNDDNLWHTYRLRAGTYYYPVYAVQPGPERASGVPTSTEYQLHIAARACPVAACCTGDDCLWLNELECAEIGGYWLYGVVTCGTQPNCDLPDSDGSCCTGSCCIEPYGCEDETPAEQPMTESECLAIPGEYVGGASCTDDPAPCPEGPCEIEDVFPATGDLTIEICDPAVCCPCTIAQPPLPDPRVPEFGGNGTRNRYLSFMTGSTGLSEAMRVTFVNLPPPHDGYNGDQWWVGPPQAITEAAGSDGIPPNPNPPPHFWTATLQCGTPYYDDWTQYDLDEDGEPDAIHVYHDGIIPGANYHVQAIADHCDPADSDDYSSPLPINTSVMGDIVGDCGIRPCSPPQGTVDLVDISACVEKFTSDPIAPQKSRADVINSNVTAPPPDRVIDFVDITTIVEAFRGTPLILPGPQTHCPPQPLSAGSANLRSEYDTPLEIVAQVLLTSEGLPDAIIERDCPPYQDGVPIITELTLLELAGDSPEIGRVFIHESADLVSDGRICRVDADEANGDFISGDSYFNVYLEIHLPDTPYGGMVVFNPETDPVVLQKRGITQLPPTTEIFKSPGLRPPVCSLDPVLLVPLRLMGTDCETAWLVERVAGPGSRTEDDKGLLETKVEFPPPSGD